MIPTIKGHRKLAKVFTHNNITINIFTWNNIHCGSEFPDVTLGHSNVVDSSCADGETNHMSVFSTGVGLYSKRHIIPDLVSSEEVSYSYAKQT